MTALAQVAVESTVYHFDKLFTYRVPERFQMQLLPGMRVTVPFGAGNRERIGVVFALGGQDGNGLKEGAYAESELFGISVLDERPVLLYSVRGS